MNLPPQAYTKETLIQAYNWLRTQPTQVQELAKSPETLVALYSKAQMHGDSFLNRTNLQGFKSELKNLANIMGDFEENPDENSATTQNLTLNSSNKLNSVKGSYNSPSSNLKSSSSVNGNSNVSFQSTQQSIQSHSTASFQQTPPIQTSDSQNIVSMNYEASKMAPIHQNVNSVIQSFEPNPLGVSHLGTPIPNTELRGLIDPRSWTLLQEVKIHFNLSSESEALRLLITLGYQKVRSQF